MTTGRLPIVKRLPWLYRGLWVSLLVAVSGGVRADIVLSGIIKDAVAPRFLLSSKEDKTEKWVKLGEDFNGFTVLAFDASTESLTIESKDGKKELHLRDAAIAAASPEELKAKLRQLKGQPLYDELLRLARAFRTSREGEEGEREALLVRIAAANLQAKLSASVGVTKTLEAKRKEVGASVAANSAVLFLAQQETEMLGQTEAAAQVLLDRLFPAQRK